MNRLILTTATAIGCLALAGAANAATILSESTALPADHYTAPTHSAGTVNPAAGSITNEYASPFGSGSTDVYGAVLGGDPTTNFAEYNFTGNAVSLIWGSPDSYNTLSFYLGTTLVDSITGSSIGDHLKNYYVTIRSAFSFDSIRLTSGTNAFEFSNVSVSTVPLPASLPMFGGALLALAGFGYGMNRWVAPKGTKASTAA